MTRVAILGYGVVGSGLVELIDKNRELKKEDSEIEITGILVRDKEKHKNDKHYDVVTTDIDELLSRECEIVVELIGGIDNSYEYVKKAIELEKSVITANKDLIAEHGDELIKLADDNVVELKFEASVGGGIPIIKTITESLVGNDINEIKTIINVTTNFILTKMYNENLEYEDALRKAQELGFAESNPEADIMGYDAGRKLAILSGLCYRKKIYWKDISIEGIASIDSYDIKYAKLLKSNIKLIGHSIKNDNKLYSVIRPVLVDNNNILSTIDNEMNIVQVFGDAIDESIYIGKGAGKLPTASAVYSDLMDIINNRGAKIEVYNEKISNIENKIENQCTALIRLSTDDVQVTMETVDKKFKIIKRLNESPEDELALFIEADKEIDIDEVINELINNEIVYSAKKIISI